MLLKPIPTSTCQFNHNNCMYQMEWPQSIATL
uniref:Uncharacterized protein n=1 Tax=Arundo donax TaxID=35708 RepID=A0A0A9GKF8_ARUDO